MLDEAKARFIDPMLLLKTEELPEGPGILYELKLDGYRTIAFTTGGKVHLRSRNDNDFSARYPSIVKALPIPDDTVIDGEIVALDPTGKPSFNLLQNYSSSKAPLVFFAFDAMISFRKRRNGRKSRNTARAPRNTPRFKNLYAKVDFIGTGTQMKCPCEDLHSAALRIIDAYGPERCVCASCFPNELWTPKITYQENLRIFRKRYP